MTRPVDVHGILERAGADADAPEGSQAWGLAQVDASMTNLIAALQGMLSIGDSVTQGQERERREEWLPKARAALANIGDAQ